MPEIPTLHDASMLWIVMHIAMTVKTGDQPSLPNMDAQICATEISNSQGGCKHTPTCPFEYTCFRSKRFDLDQRTTRGWEGHEPDEQVLCECRPRRTALQGQISGMCYRT